MNQLISDLDILTDKFINDENDILYMSEKMIEEEKGDNTYKWKYFTKVNIPLHIHKKNIKTRNNLKFVIKQHSKIFISIVSILVGNAAYGYFPINVFRPYDINLRPPVWKCGTWQITSYYEGGYKTRGANSNHSDGDVLSLWQDKQDARSSNQRS